MPPEPSSLRAGITEPVMLAFWDCGHVEVDDGSAHECDGRDVCTATYHRLVPAEAFEFRVRWRRDGRAATGRFFQTEKGATEKLERLLQMDEDKFTDELWSAYGDMPDIVEASIERRAVGEWEGVRSEDRSVTKRCEECGHGLANAVDGDGCPRCMREAERGTPRHGINSNDDIPF